MSDKKLIWSEEAKNIIKKNWGRFGPELIRGMVIYHQQLLSGMYDNGLMGFNRPYHIPTIGGIIYQAWKMEIIDDAERINLIKACKARGITGKARDAIMERDNYLCKRCGDYENLTVDHVIPSVLGGKDNPENLQVLCRTCNNKKSANPNKGGRW